MVKEEEEEEMIILYWKTTKVKISLDTLLCTKSKYLVPGGKADLFFPLLSKSTLLAPRFTGLCCGMDLGVEGSLGW